MRLIKVPYGEGGLGKTLDTQNAPPHIIDELENIYLNEKGSNSKFKILEVEIEKNSPRDNYSRITNTCAGKNFIAIGGDHSITYPCSSAFLNYNSGMIIFDAHPDLMDYTDVPSHEDYLRMLVDKEYINPENVILVGIRNPHENEIKYLKEKGIKYFTAKQIFNNGIVNICDGVMTSLRYCQDLYISIDIDVLDPGFAPGTVNAEPGGISTRELLYFLSRLKYLNKSYSADIVEVSPAIDINNITCRTAAKLIKELL
ncbi:MAG: arginase family protein [Nanobdellota archaeon]